MNRILSTIEVLLLVGLLAAASDAQESTPQQSQTRQSQTRQSQPAIADAAIRSRGRNVRLVPA